MNALLNAYVYRGFAVNIYRCPDGCGRMAIISKAGIVCEAVTLDDTCDVSDLYMAIEATIDQLIGDRS